MPFDEENFEGHGPDDNHDGISDTVEAIIRGAEIVFDQKGLCKTCAFEELGVKALVVRETNIAHYDQRTTDNLMEEMAELIGLLLACHGVGTEEVHININPHVEDNPPKGETKH